MHFARTDMKDASLCGKDMMKLGNRGLLFKAITFINKHYYKFSIYCYRLWAICGSIFYIPQFAGVDILKVMFLVSTNGGYPKAS